MRNFFRSSFGAAVAGGAVVGLLFAVAIAAGWIESDAEPPSAVSVAEPLASPVADTDEGDEGASTAVNEIYRRDGRGIAFVSADRGGGEGEQPLGPFGPPEGEGGAASGSGFVIDKDGHVITNSHVVDGATDVEVTLGGSDEETYPAEIVGNDPATDVALLKADAPAEALHPLALADSSQVEVGDPVVAIGNPFGLDNTVTTGIVSALQRQIQAPNGFSISSVIQTDAAINPGNSGGPLIDMEGRVIGINSQIQTGGNAGNVGIGFAVPINTAKDVVEQIKADGEVRHAYLGISGGSITADLAEALELPVEEGVLINEVVEGGPADEAGIKGGDDSASIEGANIRVGGDIVVKVDGEAVGAMDEVIEAVNAAQPGDKLVLTVRRGEGTKTISVELGVRPESAEDTRSGPVGPPAR
jgi:S1-C subfamily serine protease